MSERIKDLLAGAAGPDGRGDEGWHAGRTDRLYFHHPEDVNAAGMVDVIGGDKEPAYVRVEMWVSPALAAEMIARVTGRVASTEVWIRRHVERDVREENAEHYRRRVEISPEVAAEIAGVSPDDIARDKELRALIAAQSEDDE